MNSISTARFRGILLDMDGTLVDSTAVVNKILNEFAVEYGVDQTFVSQHAHGLQTIDQIRLFLPQHSDAEHRRIEAHMDHLEETRTAGIVEIPGAAEFVERLKGGGIPHAIVTSASRRVALTRMRAAGIAVPDLVISADDCSDGKPAPTPYLMGAKLIDVPVSQCVAFEDAEAGLRSVVDSGAYAVVVGPHDSELTQGISRLKDFRGIRVTAYDDGWFSFS